MFFEKVVEMGNLFESQHVGNFGHVPGAMFQKNFRFLQNPFGDKLRSRFVGRFFYGAVEVVYMYIQLFCEIKGAKQR